MLTEPLVTSVALWIVAYLIVSLFIRFGKHAKKYEDERKAHEIGIAVPIYFHIPMWIIVAVLNVVATHYAHMNTAGHLTPHQYTVVMALNFVLIPALAGFHFAFWIGQLGFAAGASFVALSMSVTMMAFLAKAHFFLPMGLFIPCIVYTLYNSVLGLNFGFGVGRVNE